MKLFSIYLIRKHAHKKTHSLNVINFKNLKKYL